MASIASTHLTVDEFWQLPERPGVWLELVDGEVVEVPGAGGVHVEMMLYIFDLLRAYIREHDLGKIYPDGFGYLLQRDPDVLRIPDISFIASERIPDDWPPVSYSTVVPDLVVEIVSPGNDATELLRRTQDYVDAGASLVWIVWPIARTVSVYAGNLNSTGLRPGDTLDGGDVLPGFSVSIADLFDIES